MGKTTQIIHKKNVDNFPPEATSTLFSDSTEGPGMFQSDPRKKGG
jgi:hypothetical protein